MSVLTVYVTTADRDEARSIGHIVVTERLAACANIVDGVTSIYRWQGRVETANEALLVLKTSEHRLTALTDRIKALHSYETPCVVALRIVGGNQDFLAWVEVETQE